MLPVWRADIPDVSGARSGRGIADAGDAAACPCLVSEISQLFFFFQAEDGIRDVAVTGVQTCALPILKLADTTVVVLVPESGDAIQTMKAGLMEAADVFLVNKADRSGAPALMAELTFAARLSLTSAASPKNIGWEIPVLSAEAQSGVGIAELLADVRRHRAALEAAGALAARRRARRREELKTLLLDEVRQKRSEERRVGKECRSRWSPYH